MATVPASYTQQFSPAEKAARIRRCWRALQSGVEAEQLLRARRFSTTEIEAARAEMRKAEHARRAG